jgi:THO complex subunit 2
VRLTLYSYRQTKYNLLREQSEGFSKLITELIASLGPPPDPTTGRPVETAQEIQARAQATWNRLMGLVGFFDLDPNRTLDIILDVFTTYVATHWTFFVALLNCSPWAARTSRGPRVQGEMPSFAGKTFEEILTLAQEHAQGPVPPPVSGPRGLVAQLVGLKFRYYQQLDVAETAPKELALTAALLVREHFMTLEEIWVHLGEDDFRKADPAMDALRAAYDEDVKERVAAAKVSQLAMAAPLESADTSKPAKAKVAEPPKSKAEERKQLAASNQRVALVISLLSLGALRTALPVLSRYPWLVDAVPQVDDLLLELLAHSTSHLCAESRPGETKVQDKMDFSPPPNPLDAPEPDWTVSKARYGASGMTRLPPPKPQLTTILPVPLRTSTTYFVYFFADWANQIPVLKEWDDVIPVVGGFLSYLKVHAHRNTYFFHRLICLVFQHLLVAKAAAKELGEESPVRAFWFTMLRAHIIPAYSLLRGNAGCAVTLHSVLRHYEPTSRWPLYAEWKSTMMQSHPELRLRAIQVDRETKGILRRLSHETVDNLDGAIAKLTHHNPCIFFSHALNQVMAYSNLSTVLIKAFGRLTMLSFDVLYYLICDALANPNKERVKDDGVNLTDWLQNLSSFAAELGRRYATSELAQLLRYIVHQLYNRQTTEIVVLQDIIAKMAGIEPLPSLQDKQVAAMSGGPMLRIEAVASAQRGAAQNWNLLIPSSASKLSLYMTESSLATPLLVLVCQQRQACVFHASDTHLRSLSSLFDNVRASMYILPLSD